MGVGTAGEDAAGEDAAGEDAAGEDVDSSVTGAQVKVMGTNQLVLRITIHDLWVRHSHFGREWQGSPTSPVIWDGLRFT